jgi:arginase
MKKTLLVKAHSRIGMKFMPFGGEHVPNIGVEEGSDAVLDSKFLNTIHEKADFDLIEYVFSNPDTIDSEKYYTVVAEETNTLAQRITKALDSGTYDKLIMVGGDHGTACASVLAVLRFFKDKKVGLVDFDSHGDIHLLGTSPSGNFHGMWLRPFLDSFDESHIRNIIDVQLPTDRCLYIGNMITEAEEERFIQENHIQAITSENIVSDKQHVIEKIKSFCASVDVIHLTFDIDVFKKDIVSATGTPNPNGFDEEMVAVCMDTVLGSGKLFSTDVVEVNPKKDNPEKTIEMAQGVILSVLEKSV